MRDNSWAARGWLDTDAARRIASHADPSDLTASRLAARLQQACDELDSHRRGYESIPWHPDFSVIRREHPGPLSTFRIELVDPDGRSFICTCMVDDLTRNPWQTEHVLTAMSQKFLAELRRGSYFDSRDGES